MSRGYHGEDITNEVNDQSKPWICQVGHAQVVIISWERRWGANELNVSE